MYLCARDIDLPVSMNILVDFGTVPTEWYFLIYKKKHRARVKFGSYIFMQRSIRCPEKLSNSCSARGTGRVTLVKFSMSIQNNLFKTYSYIIIVDKLRSIQE